MLVRVVLLFVVLAVLGGSLYFLIKRNDQPTEVFETREVQTGTIIKRAVATGAIEPRQEIIIKSRVSGVVETLFMEAGETVDKNALIAKIKIVPDAVTLNSAKDLFDDNLISRDEYAKYQYDYEIQLKEQESAISNLSLIREGGNGEAGTVSSEIRTTVGGTVLEIPVKEGETVTETNNFNEGTTIASVADMTDKAWRWLSGLAL